VEAIFTVKKTPKHCLGKTSALKIAFQTFNRLTVGEGLSQNIFTVKNAAGILPGMGRNCRAGEAGGYLGESYCRRWISP
jgi:hypothetical protein